MTTEIDYKDTLNLPLTEFPMKASLAMREPKILEKWQKLDIYKQMLSSKDKSKPFQLNDGPPYANGDIHIGHALNKILKDIVVKSNALKGYYTPFIPGWDCHGLPIELQVEKKIGKAGVKVDARTFREECRKYANKQINIQRDSFKRLGIFADWDNPYITMDYKFEANIIRTLGKIVERGHLVRGDRPVHWCVHCGSALAEAEVEYMDKTSDAIDVLFAVNDTNKLATIFNTTLTQRAFVAIWTTTPWTLPANQGVAVNENLEYSLVATEDKYLIVASDLVENVMHRAEIKDFQVVAKCLGNALTALTLQHPFYERTVPVVLGDHVTTDAGTGCVHIAPAHGLDDYIVGKKNNLPIDNPVDGNGCFFAAVPIVGGKFVFKTQSEIIEVLRDKKHLLAAAKLEHSYPHCWRHKEPLIFRATPQWFISMDAKGLRSKALDAIKDVKWFPQWAESRITGMVADRPDWCISRQRTWGTPIVLLVHKETGAIHPNMLEIIEKVAKLVEESGVQAWFDLALNDILNDSEIENYEKVTDMLDVWFDSGAVHYCVAEQRPEMHSPVDLYLEGSDQHRGWFQSSLLSAIAMHEKAPYKQVLTHGFTVDADGKKMSKSLGNVVAPSTVIKTLGADILRLWVAATDYRAELRISDEILRRTADSYRRIRNTARFLLANLHGFNPATDMLANEDMLMLDRWIVDQASNLQEQLLEAYENYDFHLIYQNVHNFCSNELGSFYLDIIKDRQYTCKENSVARRSAQSALYHIINALVRWIAPILSFTAEEIWQFMPGQNLESVFLAETYTDLMRLSNTLEMNDDFWRQIKLVRDAVNKVLETSRTNNEIGSGLEADIVLYCNDELYNTLAKLKNELRFILITSSASILPLAKANDNCSETTVPGLLVAISKSMNEKCQRCWHRTADVDEDPNYPNICMRCVNNLTKEGEVRVYA